MIASIETEYRGRRFRSRLEARWAVVFDTERSAWDYELEAFATRLGPYLPDFRVTEPRWSRGNGITSWVEVKPQPVVDDVLEWASDSDLVDGYRRIGGKGAKFLLPDPPEPLVKLADVVTGCTGKRGEGWGTSSVYGVLVGDLDDRRSRLLIWSTDGDLWVCPISYTNTSAGLAYRFEPREQGAA